MGLIAVNARLGKARVEVRNGRKYLVAPASILVPGVLNGSNGALFYPQVEIGRNYLDWNNVPLTVYHPTSIDGAPLSAKDDGVLSRQGIGHVERPSLNGKLGVEAWFDYKRTQNADQKFGTDMLRRLERGEPIELSTGLYTDNEEESGTFNGKQYTAVARNYRPDHVAVLPNGVGACSIADGCGIHNELTDNTWSDEAREASAAARSKSGAAVSSGKGHEAAAQSNMAAAKVHLKAADAAWKSGDKSAASQHQAKADEHNRIAQFHQGIHNEQPRHPKTGQYQGLVPTAAKRGHEDGRQLADIEEVEDDELGGEPDDHQNPHLPVDNAPSDDVDPEKACQILKDGTVKGHELTEEQRGMFGAACGHTRNTWTDEAREAAAAARKAMPGGTKHSTDYSSWSKKGGYAGAKSIEKTVAKLKAAGFVEKGATHIGGVGSEQFGGGKILEHPSGHTFQHSSSYGVTKDNNRFNMHLKLKEPTSNDWSPEARDAAAAARSKSSAAHQVSPNKRAEGFSRKADSMSKDAGTQKDHALAAKAHKEAATAHMKAYQSSGEMLHKDAADRHTIAAQSHVNASRVHNESPHEASKNAAMSSLMVEHGPARDFGMRAVDHSAAGRSSKAADLHIQAAESHENAATQARQNGMDADDHDHAAMAHRRAASMHTATTNAWTEEARTASAAARKASGKANASSSSKDHVKAAVEHQKAADVHSKAGNTYMASRHQKASEHHERQAESSEVKMNRNQKLALLTANCKCEDDRALLNQLSDETLFAFNTEGTSGSGSDTDQAGGAEDDDDDDDDYEVSEVGDKKLKGKKVENMEQWLERQPAGVQELIRESSKVIAEKKHGLVGRIVANAAEGRRKELSAKYMKMSVGELEDMASLIPAPRRPLYLGTGGVVDNTEQDEDAGDTLEVATLNYAEISKPGGPA